MRIKPRSTIPSSFQRGVVLRATGGPSILKELSNEQIAVDLEDACRLNVAALAVQVYVGGEYETQTIRNLTRLVDMGNRYGIPSFAVTAVGKNMVRDAKYFRLACRICAELGAHFVKTYYVPEGFDTVAASCPVPLVMAFVLAPSLENSVGRTLDLAAGNIVGYVVGERPIALAILLSHYFAGLYGIAIAARMGAAIADAEFVQFHPTAIDVDVEPVPLATEALRGEGAVLVDREGRRFMPDYHGDAEMGPRDIVARAVFEEIRAEVGGYNVPLPMLMTGGALPTCPVNGRVPPETNPELIHSARDKLFTSGTLSRFSETLNVIIEAPGGLYGTSRAATERERTSE